MMDDSKCEVKVKPEDEDNKNKNIVNYSDLSYEDKIQYVNEISVPMASRKLTKKCYKLVKAAVPKKSFTNGLRDVQKRLRKGDKGLVLFAGDVRPIDIMCHLPAICEEHGIPYMYIPSRHDLGSALGFRRGCITVLVRAHPDYQDLYDELKNEFNKYSMDYADLSS